MKRVKKSQLIFSLAFIGFLLLSSITSSHAQRRSGQVGIGLQAGQPTSLDFLAAWDLNDFFFLNVHGLKDASLNREHTVHFFYGPGAFIGIRNISENNDDVELGVSGSFGLDFIVGSLEFYIQATPRLTVIDATNFDMGGGFGVRIYL